MVLDACNLGIPMYAATRAYSNSSTATTTNTIFAVLLLFFFFFDKVVFFIRDSSAWKYLNQKS